MNRTARCVRQYCVMVYKLIIFLHSKRYRPSSMLSLRQNSHASRGRKRTCPREAQSRECVKFTKEDPVLWVQEMEKAINPANKHVTHSVIFLARSLPYVELTRKPQDSPKESTGHKMCFICLNDFFSKHFYFRYTSQN
jgi:hypothetical protein